LWATPDSWQGLKPEMTEAVLAAYNEGRPLSEVEWEVLPDFLLLLTLADAAEYVSRGLAADPARAAVPGCLAYRRFVELERERSWVTLLRPGR
jgi:Ser/Thr protein kinase RdoA (MazF antagonist)